MVAFGEGNCHSTLLLPWSNLAQTKDQATDFTDDTDGEALSVRSVKSVACKKTAKLVLAN
jgi:hypothetical protein